MPSRRTRLALAAALLAAGAAPLHAQPACLPGTLQSYLDAGSCRVGALAFSGFRYDAFVSSPGLGVTAAYPDPRDVLVTPTLAPGPGGADEVALAFAGLVAGMTVAAPTPVDSFPQVTVAIGFSVATLPGRTIGRSGAAFAVVQGPLADDPTAATPRPIASVEQQGGIGGPGCVNAVLVDFAASGPYAAEAPCDPGVTTLDVFAVVSVTTDPPVDGATALTPGAASSGLDRLSFVVSAVPEPATLWLVGLGMLGLLGAARPRRRTSA